MLASEIPSKIQLPFAATGTKNAIPVPSQVSITPGAASYTDGFPPLTFTALSAGGIPPDGADMNGILNALSAIQQWQSAGGIFKYDSAFSTAVGGYPAGSVLLSSDGVTEWLNLADDNTTDPDGGSAAGWVSLAAYGITAVTGLTNTNVTLTPAQFKNDMLTLAGTLTGNVQLIFPAHLKRWLIINNTTGDFSITCKTAAGTGVIVTQAQSVEVYCDGTNVLPTGLTSETPTDIAVRQTVEYGPVDSNGFAAFGGSTGATTVSGTGTLYLNAANGMVNRRGSITNPSWTGASTNGTMYAYLDIAADGTCTSGLSTLAPVYQFGGTYSTTSGQFTFNIQEMTGKVGNGSTAVQTYRVYVGEFTVAGGVVTAITWYALMRRSESAYVTPLPGFPVYTTTNHNIGTTRINVKIVFECLTTEYGYAVGDIVEGPTVNASGLPALPTFTKTRNAVGFMTANTQAFYLLNRSTGASSLMTPAYWKYKVVSIGEF